MSFLFSKARGRALERMQQDPDMMQHEIGLPSGHPPESTADKQASMPVCLSQCGRPVASQQHTLNTHTKCLIDAVGGVAALNRSTTRFYQKAFADPTAFTFALSSTILMRSTEHLL